MEEATAIAEALRADIRQLASRCDQATRCDVP
jgi:hypothetical protein